MKEPITVKTVNVNVDTGWKVALLTGPGGVTTARLVQVDLESWGLRYTYTTLPARQSFTATGVTLGIGTGSQETRPIDLQVVRGDSVEFALTLRYAEWVWA